MPVITASASAEIAAPAAGVYRLIADYRDGHPRILPPEYFGRLEVESGGVGEGTRIRFEMKAFGRVNVARASVTEPVPGRELRETTDTGIVTTFLVEPLGNGGCRVTIDTRYQRRGLGGVIEGLVAPGFLRKVYRAELERLRLVATGPAR